MSSELPRREHARRLRHDLGKYISLQVRWLGEGPALAALEEAFVADLLSTRRGPNGVTDAVALWTELQQDWQGEWISDPDVQRITAAMGELKGLLPLAQTGRLTPEQVQHGVSQARLVTEATRALATRLLQGE